MRGGEMAALGEVPFGRYYGSCDATPLFVMLAYAYYTRTGDLELIDRIWPNIEAALRWMETSGDPDQDGFIDYARKSETGLINQGWKDSHDSIFHSDGSTAEGPIALSEVQGYAYAAWSGAAQLAALRDDSTNGREFSMRAERLRERFELAFWCEDLDTYALALDGRRRPCRVRTSNPGHCLFAGIVAHERAKRLCDTLMAEASFNGWGVRTVAAGERRYNPQSYHNGSIWPHDNALIALGLSRYGLNQAVEQVFKGLFEAATYMDLRRLPELFCGFQRQRNNGPTLYPVACSPQAWASATPFSLVEAALGLEFEPRRGEIRLRNPRLPSFLDAVTLRNLQLGHARVDVTVRRHGDDVSLEILRARGRVQVSIISSR
jgi:glycogen debranching enzyme